MQTDPARQYAHEVLSGKIAACEWVQAAARRHLNDLEDAGERGLWYDPAAAARVIQFFGFLKHSKGEWAGQTFKLELWQLFVLSVLFGWKRPDGNRRFRTAYLEVPRKNGKSTLLAGIGLYLMIADGEGGAEVYTVATKRDQALITHSEATRMVKSSPGLRARVQIYKNNLSMEGTASKFEPLASDHDTLDGLNVHGAIIDELHAHKTRDLWDVLDTATGARRQPLMVAITTAGYDRQSICWKIHEHTQKVLEGSVRDDAHFGIIYTIDAGDDCYDESAWEKANPNWGVSVKTDDMRRLADQARSMPSGLNSFLRLKLNVWTQAETRWLSYEKWAACGTPVDAAGLRGRACFAGLDLSSTTDVTAWVLVFPPEVEGEKYQILPRFFIPGDNVKDRVDRDRVPYDVWIRTGAVTATPGNVIDYGYVMAQIDEDARAYDIREVAFDRWGATKIVQDLQDRELSVVEFGQGFASMSAPTKELERLILGGKIAHGGNEPFSWMAANVVVKQDAAGNIKPDKEKSTEKIDGIVALIMALDRAIRHAEDLSSVYASEEVMIL